jgi:hypothetical protein
VTLVFWFAQLLYHVYRVERLQKNEEQRKAETALGRWEEGERQLAAGTNAG